MVPHHPIMVATLNNNNNNKDIPLHRAIINKDTNSHQHRDIHNHLKDISSHHLKIVTKAIPRLNNKHNKEHSRNKNLACQLV